MASDALVQQPNSVLRLGSRVPIRRRLRWWHRRLRDLIDVVGLTAVSEKTICVEHFPSKRYQPIGAAWRSTAVEEVVEDEHWNRVIALPDRLRHAAY